MTTKHPHTPYHRVLALPPALFGAPNRGDVQRWEAGVWELVGVWEWGVGVEVGGCSNTSHGDEHQQHHGDDDLMVMQGGGGLEGHRKAMCASM